MKSYKKVSGLFLMSAMALTILSACGGGTAVSAEWEIDKDNHWHLTESGEKTNVSAHSLEEDICSVCGAEITDFGGEVWVTKSNENGDGILMITYDADGNVIQNMKSEYTYDKNGNWATEKVYEDGRLYIENIFTTVSTEEESYTYAEQVTTYNEDGTKLVENYDKNGWATEEKMYQADGTVDYEYTVVNEFNDLDLIASIKKYDGETLVTEIRSEYDADGNLTTEKTYSGENLVKEDIYTNIDGFGYLSKEIVFNEDGTQTVTEYDEYGEVIE